MGRSPCCSQEGLNRGAWTALEDNMLTSYIKSHGEGKWRNLPKRAGLKRCGKSCRLRWLNYLRPDIKRGNITHDEEELIIRLHKLLGNRWSLIAGRLPGRTDNEIKNYWNTNLAKKVKAQSASVTKQDPSSKSRESKPVTAATRPHIIQTKATKCKNVLTLASPSTKENSFTNPLAPNQLVELQANQTQLANHTKDAQTSKARFADEDPLQEDYNPDVNHIISGSNQFHTNAADFCRDFKFDSDVMSTDLADQSLPIEELLVNCWTTIDELEDKGTMDLDSLGFLLETGDWP